MMQTHTSQRSQRSSHNPYRNFDDKMPTNPFLDEKLLDETKHHSSDNQTQLSPMFIDYLRAKTGAPVDLEKIDTSDKYRGVKIAQTISPVDGKTVGCDREHTFESFVDQRRISGDAGREKKIGHGWQVARALKRVMSSKARGSRKARPHDDALPVRLAA